MGKIWQTFENAFLGYCLKHLFVCLFSFGLYSHVLRKSLKCYQWIYNDILMKLLDCPYVMFYQCLSKMSKHATNHV